MHSQDNVPIRGVRLLIERQVSADNHQGYVDTVSSDAEGKVEYAVTYPNKYMVTIYDTTRYVADTAFAEFANADAQAFVIKSIPRYGTASIRVNLKNSIDNSNLEGLKIELLLRASSEEGFTRVDDFVTDENGNIEIADIAFPVQFKVRLNENTLLYDEAEFVGNLTVREGVDVALLTTARFGYGDYHLQVSDYFNESVPLSGEEISVRIKGVADDDYHVLGDFVVGADGMVLLEHIMYPAEIKVTPKDLGKFALDEYTFTLTEAEVNTTYEAVFRTHLPRYPHFRVFNADWNTASGNTLASEVLDLSAVGIGNAIRNIVTDSRGNVYISERARIIRVDKYGNATNFAGVATTTAYADGALADARFFGPWGMDIDDDDNLYVADCVAGSGSHRIRKITINHDDYTGMVSTVAGNGVAGATDGIGTAAQFDRPSDVAFSKSENCLYVAEWNIPRFRRIDLNTGEVTTIGTNLGLATNSRATGVALSPDEKIVYFITGQVTAGNRLYAYDVDARSLTVLTASTSIVNNPRGIFVAADGTVIISNNNGHNITFAIPNATHTSIASNGVILGGTSGDAVGSAANTRFSRPLGVWYDPYTAKAYIADQETAAYKVKVLTSTLNN